MNTKTCCIACVILVLITISCKKEGSSSVDIMNGRTKAVFNDTIAYGTLTDQEGNIYNTVRIGNHTWMAENLRTTIFNDGEKVPMITDNDVWAQLSTPACCSYNNTNDLDTIATFGLLYNWHAVGTGKLAPEGWHVATDEDWWILVEYLGDKAKDGSLLKETGTSSWLPPNSDATNSSGFTALASGSRFGDGTFTSIGYSFHCWRYEKYLDKYGISWYVSNNYSLLGWAFYLQQFGFSVRCVKD